MIARDIEGEQQGYKPTGLLFLEPDLSGVGGHFFGYLKEIAAVCRLEGIPMVVISRKGLEKSLCSQLEALGVIVEPRFKSASRCLKRAPRCLKSAPWFQRLHFAIIIFALTAIPVVHRYPDCIPVILAGRTPLLLGAVACAAFSKSRPVFEYMSWQTRIRQPASKRASTTTRLLAAIGHRLGLRIVSETSGLAPLLSAYLEQPVSWLPTIAPWPGISQEKIMPKSNSLPRVGILGAGYWRKNLGQFVEALETDCTHFQAVIQVDHVGSDIAKEHALTLATLKNYSVDFELIEEAYNELDFNRLLLSLDVLALPSRPTVYATSASGLFTQALGLGIIPVVAAGTSMAELAATEGVGVVYENYTATDLRRALDYAVENRQELRQKIMEQAPDWRKHHSARNLVDRLFRISELEPDQ